MSMILAYRKFFLAWFDIDNFIKIMNDFKYLIKRYQTKCTPNISIPECRPHFQIQVPKNVLKDVYKHRVCEILWCHQSRRYKLKVFGFAIGLAVAITFKNPISFAHCFQVSNNTTLTISGETHEKFKIQNILKFLDLTELSRFSKIFTIFTIWIFQFIFKKPFVMESKETKNMKISNLFKRY